MSSEHLSFADLSDLFDGQVGTEEERERMLAHIEECPACEKEYNELRTAISFMREIGRSTYDLGDLASSTMARLRRRKREKLVRRVAPVAAAILFVFLAIPLTLIPGSDTEKPVALQESVDSTSDVQQIIDIIRNNNANIVKITDHYIEGEVSMQQYQTLRRSLGFRDVTASVRPRLQEQNQTWRNIENVGGGNTVTPAPDSADAVIRFRVHR